VLRVGLHLMLRVGLGFVLGARLGLVLGARLSFVLRMGLGLVLRVRLGLVLRARLNSHNRPLVPNLGHDMRYPRGSHNENVSSCQWAEWAEVPNPRLYRRS
jgi:hypothetical protein